jgi:hypothetical protein
MTNREAINWLTRIRDRLMTTSSKQFESMTIAIAALEKQEQDRWHSVAKEGNPKESGHYIVVDKNPINGNKSHIRYFNAYGDASFWSGWRADKVIAWKEIASEPYKAEDEV